MAVKRRASGADGGDETYLYLERRPENWRTELFLKGRNMTVGHLVCGMRANKLTPEAAAENYDLPPAAQVVAQRCQTSRTGPHNVAGDLPHRSADGR